MKFKPSSREKMLRRIAASVKESMGAAVGHGQCLVTEWQDELDFLTEEIQKDRNTNWHAEDQPRVKPL